MMELQALLDRVLGLGQEQDWEGAAEVLREHLPTFDEEAEVHCALGVAERELGLDGVAYERFKRALSLNPMDPYVLATAGNAIASFDDPDAEPALRAAALMGPDVAVARYLYGAYLSREGFVTEALVELEAARRLDGEDPQIAYELGVARYFAGDLPGAIDAMGDAVRIDHEDGWFRIVSGLVLLEAGEFDEAVVELTEGAYLHTDDVEAQLTAALAAAAFGSEAVAYEMLERGRIRAGEEDAGALLAVEDRVDSGPEAAQALLMEELAPDSLRRRLQIRP